MNPQAHLHFVRWPWDHTVDQLAKQPLKRYSDHWLSPSFFLIATYTPDYSKEQGWWDANVGACEHLVANITLFLVFVSDGWKVPNFDFHAIKYCFPQLLSPYQITSLLGLLAWHETSISFSLLPGYPKTYMIMDRRAVNCKIEIQVFLVLFKMMRTVSNSVRLRASIALKTHAAPFDKPRIRI